MPPFDPEVERRRQLLRGLKARQAPAPVPQAAPVDVIPADSESERRRQLLRGLKRNEGSTLDTVIGSGLRIVPSIAGGLAGGALTAPSGPGAIAGAAGGGAAGGALGDWLAQQYEIARGIRTKYSPTETLVEAGLGAIPIKGSSRVLSAMGKGAAMSAGGTTAHSVAEQGKMPELADLLFSAGVGAATGGAFHGGVKGVQYLRARGQAADTAAAEELARRAQEATATPQMADTTGQTPVDPNAVVRGAQTPDARVTRGTIGRGGRFRQQHTPELSSPMSRTLAQGELIPAVRTPNEGVQANAERAMNIRHLMRARMAGRMDQQQSLLDAERKANEARQQIKELSELIGVDQSRPEAPSTPYEAPPGQRAPRRQVLPYDQQPQNQPGEEGAVTQADIIAALRRRLAESERARQGVQQPPQSPAGPQGAGSPPDPTVGAAGTGQVDRRAPGVIGPGLRAGSTKEYVNPADLEVSPAEYQFKQNIDKEGRTPKLKGSTWNLTAADMSPILVHRRADGRLMVADGHQRVGLAKELASKGQEIPPLEAVVLNEADGYSVQDARRLGAFYNIIAGEPEVSDIARVLRSGQLAPDEVEAIAGMRSENRTRYRQAENLTKLSDEAFDWFMRANVPANFAQYVPKHFADPGQQIDALRALQQASSIKSEAAADSYLAKRAIAGYADADAAAPVLPGMEDAVGPTSLLEGIVNLEQSVARRLASDKSAFAAAVRNKAKLEGVGQTSIDRGAAEGAAKEAGTLLGKLRAFSDKVGWTSDALKRGAADLEAGRRAPAAVEADVLAALEKDWNNVPYRPGQGPAASAEVGDGFSQAPGGTGTGAGLFDESGAIGARLATTLGGAAAGGVTGASQDADSREERIRNTVIGAFLGGVGGATAAAAATRRRALPPGTQAPQPGVTQDPGPRTVQTAAGTTIRGPKSEQGVGRRVLELGGDYNLIPGEGKIRPKELLNLDLEKFPAVVRDAVGDTLRRHGGFPEQRRNTQSWARTEELAKRLSVELDRMLPVGKALNAEQIKAYALGLTNVNAQKVEIAARIAADKAKGITNADDLVALLRANTDGDLLMQSFMGARAESGRALQIQRTFNKLLPAEARILLHGKSGAKLRGELEKMAELLATVKDPVEAMKIARDNAAWKPLERESNYFMANILSGIQTHERNIIGTATNVANQLAVKGAIGAPLDALRSTLSGKPREVFAGEVMHDAIGAVSTMDKALADAWFTLRNGFSEEALNEMLADQSTMRIARKEFRGGLANPFNVPGRALESMDRFFVTLNRGMLTHSRSYAMARQAADRAGVRPGAKGFDDFMAKEIASQRANMTDATQAQIVKEAQEAVFRGEPGTLAKWLIQGKQKMPALNFLVPFVSTISNMHRAGYEMTPLSLAVKGAKYARGNKQAFGATSREQTMTAAKGLFGTMATLPLAYLAATGRLSGAGSTDRAARDQAYERGWRPNSIKLPLPDEVATAIGAERSPDGEYWIAYNLIQPLAMPASVIANGFEAWEDVQRRGTKANMEQTVWDIFSKMSTRVANSALSQSYFTGLFGAIDALNNPDQGASQFFADLIRGFTPLSGLMRNAQRAVDPVVRRPRGLMENVAANLPGLSESVPASIGRFGDERRRSGSAVRRSVMVPEVEPVTADPIDLELERIGVQIGRPSERLELMDRRTGVRSQLTPEQAQQLQVARGTSVRAMLERVMQSPGYARQPDAVRRQMVERAIDAAGNRASNVARRSFMAGRPDALAALIERSRSAIAGGRQQP